MDFVESNFFSTFVVEVALDGAVVVQVVEEVLFATVVPHLQFHLVHVQSAQVRQLLVVLPDFTDLFKCRLCLQWVHRGLFYGLAVLLLFAPSPTR